ncbi:30S ribosomal protein S3 [Candidatus Woesearchaeota archaeon]|nr:30S ribosomal protein S3 [Candidatus Woesearchaeota archaeon]
MIERKFINQNIKEFEIKEYIRNNLSRVGLSDVKLQRTPLGEKIIISTSRPGLVVGRSGTNITKLTQDLKKVFKLENPQIEIDEVTSIGLDANIIAEMIANSLEKFGTTRFKGVGHKAMADVMGAGALGVEILISGKVPSDRAKTWRFYQGYLKKCGDVAVSEVKVAYTVAKLKSGTLGVKVSIMTPDIELPDKIGVVKKQEEIVEKVEEVEDKAVQQEMEEKIQELSSPEADKAPEAGKEKLEKQDEHRKKPRAGAKKRTGLGTKKKKQQEKVEQKKKGEKEDEKNQEVKK